MTEKELEQIEKRLKQYYDTDEINIDLANQIHSDAEKLITEVKRMDSIINTLSKTIGTYEGIRKKYEGELIFNSEEISIIKELLSLSKTNSLMFFHSLLL